MKVDLEDIRAVVGKRYDSVICKLAAVVELELCETNVSVKLECYQQRCDSGLTLLMYLQLSASLIILSFDILLQPDTLRPWSLGQFSAMA